MNWDSIIRSLTDFGFRMLGAGFVLIIGFWFANKKLVPIIGKILKNKNIDVTVRLFLDSFAKILLKVFIVITAISILGVDNTSLVAVLGAISFAIGLALQGSISNFAGGILLIVFKPMKVGDFVDIGGHIGTVDSIQILSTRLLTLDNKVIFLPNAKVSNSEIINYSVMSTRRLDQTYGVDYDSDIDQVKSILMEEIHKIESILKNPEPFVALSEHADSALIFTIRVWLNAEDYWGVHFALLENIKKRFDQEGINIPYPVVDVRLPERTE